MPGISSPDGGAGGQGKNSAAIARAVALAVSYAGRVPYVFGGTTPGGGFDCSGLVQYVFGAAGIPMPRTSEEQASVGSPVTHDQLQPGDLVFSSWGGEDPHGHVAIYTGAGKIVEAPHTGEDVHVIALDSGYLAHVTDYRRISGAGAIGALGGAVAAAGAAGATSGDNGGGLLSWPGEITDFFTGATDLITGNVSWIKAFFQPSTYIRIGAGLFGAVFLVAALFFLVRETKS